MTVRPYLPKNGRRRKCLHSGCRRSCLGPRCWKHARSSRGIDPLCPESRALLHKEWWPIAQARLADLARARIDNMWDRRLSNEVDDIWTLAAPGVVREMVAKWRISVGAPEWRLPPTGYLSRQLREYHPDLQPEVLSATGAGASAPRLARFRGEEFIGVSYIHTSIPPDLIARDQLEGLYPTQPPFRPITSIRTGHVAEHHRLLSEQEDRNREFFARHSDAILDWTGPSNPSGLARVFADSALDTRVPSGIVVFHQMAPRDARTKLSIEQHRGLSAGDVVRYQHARGSTLKAWWFGSLRNGLIPEIDTLEWALPTGIGLLLELAPVRGLYVDAVAGRALNRTLTEKELILPPRSTWRVLAHRDVYFDDSRDGNRAAISRIHVIQMEEILVDDQARESIVTDLTLAPGDVPLG